MVRDDEKEKILEFLNGKWLYCALSDFKIIKQDKEKDYSDKGVKVSINSHGKGHLTNSPHKTKTFILFFILMPLGDKHGNRHD